MLAQLSVEWETFVLENNNHDIEDTKRWSQRLRQWQRETRRLEECAFPQTQRFVERMRMLQEEEHTLQRQQQTIRASDWENVVYRWSYPVVLVMTNMWNEGVAFLLKKHGWQ